MAEEHKNINVEVSANGEIGAAKYSNTSNIALPKGADPTKIQAGIITNSVINKLHLIKLANDFPANDVGLRNRPEFKPTTFVDLCKMDSGALQYQPDDFLYCKNLGFPINRLITLRRFPYPCTDNIWDKEVQGEPDISRMVTYYNQEVNKLEELLAFSYRMKWKELTSEMEQATMQGEQSGLSGIMKKVLSVIDPPLVSNKLSGRSNSDSPLNYDPKHDQNKVYGPVDSIINTHIRDVGLEFEKEFEITFDYELRSINGRTPEYAMKDIISNILATTFNNAKFWGGSRYWVGERPSNFYKHFQYLNNDQMDDILFKGTSDLKAAISTFATKGKALDILKQAITGGFQMAMGKMLDKVGRPGIVVMNSLLNSDPTGFWHLSIGNPLNPILCVGNLICTDVSFAFPTDALSYGDFPTKLQVKIKLKPGQAKDRAGIEMMFNLGKQRIYYAPKNIAVKKTTTISDETKKFFDFDKTAIDNTLSQAYDFISDGVKSMDQYTNTTIDPIVSKMGSTKMPFTNNTTLLLGNVNPVVADAKF